MGKATILFLRCETANENEFLFFCLGEMKDGQAVPRNFESYENAKSTWHDLLFKKVSPVRRELYEKLFVAMYQPRIVTAEVDKKFEYSVVLWDEISNPFFSMTTAKMFPSYAEKLWNAGEPLVWDMPVPKIKIKGGHE